MKKLFLLILPCIMLFISGCSSANLTSYVDPDFKNKTYTNLMIFVNINSLEIRSKAEKIIVNEFKAWKLTATASIDIFPPTREVIPDEVPLRLKENNIDGVLQIDPTGASSYTQHIEGQTNTYGNATVYGNNLYYHSTSYKSPGFDINSASVSCEAKIIDEKSSLTAWKATANAHGSDGLTRITVDGLVVSIAKGIISKLRADKLIPQGENQHSFLGKIFSQNR